MRPIPLVLACLALLSLACAGPAEAPVEEPEVGAPNPDPAPRRGPPRGGRRPGREQPSPTPSPPPPSPGPSPAPSPAPSPSPAPAPSGIRQVSSDTWEVERAVVDRWESDPSRLGNAVQEGRGWRLKHLKDKDAWHLGMRNGDIVYEVNGYPLGSTAELALAWAQLQGKSDFTVRFTRDGSRLRHHYQVR